LLCASASNFCSRVPRFERGGVGGCRGGHPGPSTSRSPSRARRAARVLFFSPFHDVQKNRNSSAGERCLRVRHPGSRYCGDLGRCVRIESYVFFISPRNNSGHCSMLLIMGGVESGGLNGRDGRCKMGGGARCKMLRQLLPYINLCRHHCNAPSDGTVSADTPSHPTGSGSQRLLGPQNSASTVHTLWAMFPSKVPVKTKLPTNTAGFAQERFGIVSVIPVGKQGRKRHRHVTARCRHDGTRAAGRIDSRAR